jgi:hypothetical protein
VIFDDGTGPVEVGSISERISHTKQNQIFWRWGVDTMPLMAHGGHLPSGDAWSRQDALKAFRKAFLKGVNEHADEWPRSRDYMKACSVGRK